VDTMLIAPTHLLRRLVDRARHPQTRADELARLRARHRAQPSRRGSDPELVALADELRRLRRALADELRNASVSSCHGCARGHPLPEGRWPGGHCCGGNTLDIFSVDEVAALELGGTSLRDWAPPDGDHAGCAFRGPRGCSLEPEDRPSICLRYICLELRAELREGGQARVFELAAALRDLHERFVARRRELRGAGQSSSTSMPRSFHRYAAEASTSACVSTNEMVVPAPGGDS